MPVGSRLWAALIAACTSRAAPLMSRSKSNTRMMRVLPSELVEVISLTPAMRPSERSSGVATEAAMVSGDAPGSEAEIRITGKSSCGSGATGSRRKPRMPASAIASVSSVVATGRWINRAKNFTTAPPCLSDAGAWHEQGDQTADRSTGGKQRQHGSAPATDHGDAERTTQLRADAGAEHQRQRAPAASVVIRIGRKRSRQA